MTHKPTPWPRAPPPPPGVTKQFPGLVWTSVVGWCKEVTVALLPYAVYQALCWSALRVCLLLTAYTHTCLTADNECSRGARHSTAA